MEQFLQPLLIGLAINLILGTAALLLRLVSWSGYFGGLLIGIATFTFAGVGPYIILCTFFALGTAFSKLGISTKRARGSHQEGGRGGRHALANCMVGVSCGMVSAFIPHPELALLALTAAFATALSDTTSNELGQLLGKHPILPTTFKPVPPGTNGAVSVEGTLLGVVASLVIASIGLAFNIINWWGFLAVAIAAFLGTTVESILSASPIRGLDNNELLNFVNTLLGALFAVGIYLILTI